MSDPETSDSEKPRGAEEETAFSADQATVVRTGELSPSRPRRFEVGAQLGDYRLVRILGGGGFGEVWEAIHEPTGRQLAVKVLTGVATESHEAIERFKREGQLAASLSHPSCVYIFSAEQLDGQLAITMELMAGGTLDDLVKSSGPLPADRAVDYMLQLLDGLEAAHAMGILHRDIKPSNCFLGADGEAKIGDFGLSRTLDADDVGLTRSGSFMGTPLYAPPEQVRGRDVDFRSDLYSLGATLYNLLTAKAPFAGKGTEVLARILSEQPTPLSAHGVSVPRGLEQVVLRLLAKEKEKRFQTHAELRAALIPFSSQGLAAGTPVPRFLATLIDHLILTPFSFLFGIQAMNRGELLEFSVMTLLPPLLLWGAYFFGFERFLGKTPGKWLLGLQVSGVRSSTRAALLRSVLFVGLLMIPAQMVMLSMTSLLFNPHWGWSVSVMQWVGIALIASSMRRRNGYAGLHELGSGTRVQKVVSRDALRAPGVMRTAIEPCETKGDLGPFRALGRLGTTAEGRLIVAEDPLLHRQVWIHEMAPSASPRPIEKLRESRPARLRWLQGSRAPDAAWDAFEAPAGASLRRWIADERGLDWPTTLGLLCGLLEELVQSQEGGDHPDGISTGQLWVDERGRLRLLDFELLEGDSAPPSKRQDWRELIRELTYLALAGKAPGEWSGEIPEVSLPESAKPVVSRLLKGAESFDDPSAALESLRELRRNPIRVTTTRRVMTLLPVGGVLLSLLFFMTVFPWIVRIAAPQFHDVVFSQLYRIKLDRLEKMKDREEAERLRRSIEIVLADSWIRLNRQEGGRSTLGQLPEQVQQLFTSAAERYPDPPEAEVLKARSEMGGIESSQVLFAMLGMTLMMSLPSCLLALLLRGNLMFHVTGVSVQTTRGRRAGRWRCFGRALISFAPAFLFLVFVRIRGLREWREIFCALMLIVLLIGLIHAIRFPGRSIQDRLARTRLVPR